MNFKSSIERLRSNLLANKEESVVAPSKSPSAVESSQLNVNPAFYQFELFPEYKEYTTMNWYYEKQKFPQNLFQPHVGGSDATVVMNGREYINFSTYNYLALGFDDRVKAAAMKAVNDFGVGTVREGPSQARSISIRLSKKKSAMCLAPRTLSFLSAAIARTLLPSDICAVLKT